VKLQLTSIKIELNNKNDSFNNKEENIDLKRRHRELSGNPQEGDNINLRQSIRINTLKGNEKEIISRLKGRGIKLEKIAFLKYGYWADADFSLASTEEYLQGFFYIQEAASQMAVEWLGPKEGELILDCCASPGGKTSQIAQHMNNKGTLIALDIGQRIEKLRNNLERLGVENCIIYQQDARYFELPKGIKADKMLLDVPCSGNYAIEKDWYKKRTIKDIRTSSRLQKEIVRGAIHNLKKGGTLVYSTCSLEPEEDEEIVEWVCKEFGMKMANQRKMWPWKDNVQGFFVSTMMF